VNARERRGAGPGFLGNRLLAAVPADERRALTPFLEPVSLPLGATPYEPGDRRRYAYFPTDSIISILHVLESGASAEIAVLGNEGMLGISLFMGGDSMPNHAVVQSSGSGYRLEASVLKKEFARGGALQRVLLRYTQAVITQMAQTAVCNRHHTVEQQLCRWLLLSLDRLRSSRLRMTQQLIASMLGVRRVGVTGAAGKLQAAGLIEYHRGDIQVVNRAKLEQHVCECYGVVKREYDRLLRAPQP
jgi:CRP-like cAMP-binding protein